MMTLSPDVQARAERIKLLIMDVDGVLTDGHIYIRDNGEEIKSFHTLDGHGLKMLQQSGVQTAIITGRDAPSVGIRAKQLGIHHYYKGIHDKKPLMPICAPKPAWRSMSAPLLAMMWWICR